MTEQGMLEFVDLGTGQWLLRTDAGRVRLFGEIDQEFVGKKVLVEGDAFDGMTAGMMPGPAMVVRALRLL